MFTGLQRDHQTCQQTVNIKLKIEIVKYENSFRNVDSLRTKFLESGNAVMIVVIIFEGCISAANAGGGYCGYRWFRWVHTGDDILKLMVGQRRLSTVPFYNSEITEEIPQENNSRAKMSMITFSILKYKYGFDIRF